MKTITYSIAGSTLAFGLACAIASLPVSRASKVTIEPTEMSVSIENDLSTPRFTAEFIAHHIEMSSGTAAHQYTNYGSELAETLSNLSLEQRTEVFSHRSVPN